MIVPGKAVSVKTRTAAAIIEVHLAGGEIVECTPDHEFMLVEGNYKRAEFLKFNDSLMPLYRRWSTRDGYESVSNGHRKSRLTHLLVYEALHGPVPKGFVVHHENEVHFDNSPDNLMSKEAGEHSRHHRAIREKNKHWQSLEFEKKRVGALRAKADTDEGHEYFAKRGTGNILHYMENRPDHFRAAVAGNGQRGREFLIAYNKSEKGRKQSSENGRRFGFGRHNHKVFAVRAVDRRTDVYCLQVEDHHNFALAAGVFVHNCGMIAARTKFKADQLPDSLEQTRLGIERRIPVGFSVNQRMQDSATIRANDLDGFGCTNYHEVDPRWPKALGSLGGGNHFIEICLDETQYVWVVLHSGSRGIGNKLAQKHIKVAQRLMDQWFIKLDDRDLAYLPVGTQEFNDYITDLLWAQKFALDNREEMMDRIMTELSYLFFGEGGHQLDVEEGRINCHHNFTQQENHMGANVWITRKGAIQMRKGQMGVIPGSMGTKSYIVSGLGNRVAFESAPHGAGRRFSRTEARRRFTMEDFDKAMEGIECRKSDALIDELPGAYKDIDEVMENSKSLVKVEHVLKQILNVKGD